MEIAIASIVINAVLAIAGFAMKSMIADLKDEVKQNRQDIDRVKDTYFKKADFTEFKIELWDRLDRFEQDVKDQLRK